MTHKSVEKTLLKGSILLGAFSIFLDISVENLFPYLEFVLIWYALLLFYILIKRRQKYSLGETGIEVHGTLSLRTLRFEEINLVFTKSGFLQKPLGLSTVYIISSRYNVLIRDVEDGPEIERNITKKIESASAMRSLVENKKI